ncbi:MAG: NAD(P)H-dependent oxidoreductase [Christensenellaceae bacterium]|nr:NAD(P)H-dependent oxidoreductase [Christensenellaceae bacterium]
MDLLFINACVRGKDLSRTYAAARAFIDTIKQTDPYINITECDLSSILPEYVSEKNFAAREEKIMRKDFADPMFDLAREFADADRIVIAAPMWDLGFPAILKAYIENVSVAGISFCYTDTGSIGLCRADKMMFITTRGSDFSLPPLSGLEHGASYLRAMCQIYGIKSFECLGANGLDMEGSDAKEITDAFILRCQNRAADFIR